MDKNRIQKFLSSTRVLQFVFFVAAVTLVTYFFPREGKFRYTFQEGKPWKYGLLTAPFDFPVYKDEAVIQQERDSIMLDFQPVFSHNESIEKKSVDDFEKALSNYTEMSIPPTLRKNLVQALREAYRKGIVSSEAYTRLHSGKFKEIRILENNVAREIPVSELQSAREAYENMLNKFPDSYSHHILQTCNLNDFLNTNIAFDSITTDRLKDNLLQRIALSDGIVQAGERIVDRGEIITPQTYRILKSLETVTLKKSVGNDHRGYTILGQIIVFTCLFSFFYLFLALFRPQTFNEMRTLGFMMMLIVGISLIAFFLSEIRLQGIYLVPFAIIPIIVVTFFDSRTALYVHLITVLICAFTAPFALEFIFLQPQRPFSPLPAHALRPARLSRLLLCLRGIYTPFRRRPLETELQYVHLFRSQLCISAVRLPPYLYIRKGLRVHLHSHAGRIVRCEQSHIETVIRRVPRNLPTLPANLQLSGRGGQ